MSTRTRAASTKEKATYRSTASLQNEEGADYIVTIATSQTQSERMSLPQIGQSDLVAAAIIPMLGLHIDHVIGGKNSSKIVGAFHDPHGQIAEFGVLLDRETKTYLPIKHAQFGVSVEETVRPDLTERFLLKPWDFPAGFKAILPIPLNGLVTILALLNDGRVAFIELAVIDNLPQKSKMIKVGRKTSLTSDTLLYSVDFFDTLFWRSFLNPVDVFVAWAASLREIFPISVSDLSMALLRQEAERTAREKQYLATGTFEVNLDEIYAEFPEHILPASCVAQAITLEIAAERSTLIPDSVLIERLKACKKGGSPVVLASDTYLPRHAFDTFLEKAGLSLAFFDKVYLSHEHRLPKVDGLLRHISADFDIPPEKVLHIGDHEHNDIRGGRLVGSRVEHYAAVASLGGRIEENARKLLSLVGEQQPFARDFNGIHGYARRFIDAFPGSNNSLNSSIIAYSIGPLFVGYFSWLFTQLERANRSCILFPTREGITLSSLFKEYKLGFEPNSGARCYHLPVSRKALDFCDLVDGEFTIQVQNYLYNRKTPISAKTLANLIDYKIALGEICLADFDYPIRKGDSRSSRIINAMLRDPVFVEQLSSFGAKKRAGALAFLRSYLATKNIKISDVVIADIGWSGGIFTKLSSLLKELDPKSHSVARYVFVDQNGTNLNIRRHDIIGFVSEIGALGALGNITTNSKEILEQFLTPSSPSVKGFSDDGAILYGSPSDFPLGQVMQKEKLLALTADYVHFLTRFNTHPPTFTAGNIELLMARLYAYPTNEEISSVGNWSQDDNYAEYQAKECPVHTLIEHGLSVAQQFSVLDDFYALPNYWTFGAAALYRPKDHDAIVLRAITGQWGMNARGDNERSTLVSIEKICTKRNVVNIDNSFVGKFYVGPDGCGILRFRFYTDFQTKIWIENTTSQAIRIHEAVATVLYMDTNINETVRVSQIERAWDGMWHSNVAIGIQLQEFISDVPREISLFISVKVNNN